jgi:hypothetical protein
LRGSGQVDTDQDPIVIDYDYGEWRKLCAHRNVDDLVTCPEILPRMRRLIASR